MKISQVDLLLNFVVVALKKKILFSLQFAMMKGNRCRPFKQNLIKQKC